MEIAYSAIEQNLQQKPNGASLATNVVFSCVKYHTIVAHVGITSMTTINNDSQSYYQDWQRNNEPADYWKKYQFISGVVIPKQIPRTKLKT